MLLKSFYPLECNVAILNEFPLSLFVYELPTALLGVALAPALDFRSLNFEFWALGISFKSNMASTKRSGLLLRILSQNRYFCKIGVLRNMIRENDWKIKFQGTLYGHSHLTFELGWCQRRKKVSQVETQLKYSWTTLNGGIKQPTFRH